MKTVLQTIASTLQAMQNCRKANNDVWLERHEATIVDIATNVLPSGSGVDNGTLIEVSECTPSKIVLACGYHHMNDGGYYDGWTQHKVILTPSFDGFSMRITGRDRNDIKDYLGELFHNCLSAEYVVKDWPVAK